MTREEIWEILKSHILEIFPEQSAKGIKQEESLRELGANSVDRAEILMLTQARLNLSVPLVSFAPAKNIGELVDIFFKHSQNVCSVPSN